MSNIYKLPHPTVILIEASIIAYFLLVIFNGDKSLENRSKNRSENKIDTTGMVIDDTTMTVLENTDTLSL